MTKRKNHSAEFKARVALDAIREEMTLSELSKKYGVHSGQISTWKRAALDNMTSAFERRGRDPAPEVSAAEVELTGLELFCGLGNVQARPFCGVSLGANAFPFQASLSRELTAKPAISTSRSQFRRVALPLSELFLAEARLALSESCVFSDVSATAMFTDASRAKAYSEQIRHSLVLGRAVGSHQECPHSCGTAVGQSDLN